MCGIAGIIRWAAPVAPTEIEAMTAALAHRGPNGGGIHIVAGVALGHRRLSIIDLEGGRQPMSTTDGQLWITYNGELYNYKQLRGELQALGHQFQTKSDTEVILYAYRQWGAAAVTRFRGMFAFAIANHKSHEVFLARDHFGIKPLFYRVEPDSVSFASELNSLLKVNGEPLQGRLEGIESYLRYRYIPGPETIYRNIRHLPPGHTMRIGFDGRLFPPRRYWQFDFEEPEAISDDEAIERFDACLNDSVETHLVADVPFGVFLSGGIDSTLVASKMAKILDKRVTAFSIGFDEAEFNELRYSEQAASTLGIDLLTEIVKPDIENVLPTIVLQYGQPFADTSMIPTWYLARLARQHVPMVLSGDGGDELFAGYDRYLLFMNEGWTADLKRLLLNPRNLIHRSQQLFQSLLNQSRSWTEQFETYLGFVGRDQRERLWKSPFKQLVDQRLSGPCLLSTAQSSVDRLSFSQRVDVEAYLPGDILTKVDVATMAHGLEVRPPFVDVQVAKLAAKLPLNSRIRADSRGERILKWLPKASLERVLPNAFVHRKKMGFAIPETKWLGKASPIRNLLHKHLVDSTGPLSEWFDLTVVKEMLDRIDVEPQVASSLWAMLLLSIWREQNLSVRFQ
jgi:asparagine synthase (glutamine-hydrolysing)